MATRWVGFDKMQAALNQYERRVLQAVKQVAQYWAAVLESYMKQNAPWTDRTSNARQGLHTFIEELSNDTVRLYLSHSMWYGVYLETRMAGKWAILWPTIQRHLEPIRQMLQRIFR